VVPALRRIRSKALIVGIRTDILFPFKEQEFLAQHILGAELAIIHSQFGHDGFLLESEKLAQIISKFLKRQNNINQIQEVIVN
jgi:homoserine O-acetyltransferase